MVSPWGMPIGCRAARNERKHLAGYAMSKALRIFLRYKGLIVVRQKIYPLYKGLLAKYVGL
ncbi:hypothetical protein G1C97_1854 [Bifidobacterium sp. DSM 109959]|uniref:Uncharacterized protein n=1 Tax=Bifidobacterium olomucense TaxID=2675324 RepID=A0A7Y0HX20_9BIFI|nr:hypothetical protein [Bifidobacterium sp. DSM 109959]